MILISFQIIFRQYWYVLTNKIKVVWSKVYFSCENWDDWFPFTVLDKHQVVQSISLSKSNNLSIEHYLTQCTEEVVEILLLHSRFGLLFITVLGLPTLSKSVKLFISKEGKFQATIYLRNIKILKLQLPEIFLDFYCWKLNYFARKERFSAISLQTFNVKEHSEIATR